MYTVRDMVVVKDNKVDRTRLKIGMKGTLVMLNEHFALVRFDGMDSNIMFAPYEFFQSFKKVEERVWTEWRKMTNYSCPFINARTLGTGVVQVYARDNGKKIQVRTLDGLKAEASCNELDTFNFDTGMSIALARLSMKLTNRTLEWKIRDTK